MATQRTQEVLLCSERVLVGFKCGATTIFLFLLVLTTQELGMANPASSLANP